MRSLVLVTTSVIGRGGEFVVDNVCQVTRFVEVHNV
jgi:hypothetical protein